MLLECVPNFSEGKDTAVLDAIEASITAVPGVRLLHRTADADHNRSVFTFAGPPEAVCAAAFASCGTAAAHIDLSRHRGQHPRIGAADVVPLVPLRGLSTADAAELSRSLGRRLWEELALPVYLYEDAAAAPHRRNLAELRRGGFEGLFEKVKRPEWKPDFGAAPHPTAGITAVGARFPLVAFNVLLDTPDAAAAKAVARAVRESSGGLPFVKALGLYLETEGRAQVSMNLTRYTVTPPLTAFQAVRREAERLGAGVLRSELIGLIPQEALPDNPAETLLLPGFNRDERVLERVLGM